MPRLAPKTGARTLGHPATRLFLVGRSHGEFSLAAL